VRGGGLPDTNDGPKGIRQEALFTLAENNIRTNIKGRENRFALPFDQNKTWVFCYKRNKTHWLSSLTLGIKPPLPSLGLPLRLFAQTF